MADRNTPTTFTFEEWRVEFNELAVDLGDISALNATLTGAGATDLTEAINKVDEKVLAMAVALS